MKIITVDNKRVGITTFYENNNAYIVGMLMIHPDYQNKGIATSILNKYIELAKPECTPLFIVVWIY